MTRSLEIGEQVRQRANFACEYCGVSEIDSGGLLTMDHFRPRSRGGGDDLNNLLYCCYRCNLHKADYWPEQADAVPLWNPRMEPMQSHLLSLADGHLFALTPTGEFTLQRLRLNRPQLVALRVRRLAEAEKKRREIEKRNILALLMQCHQQQTAMHEAQAVMLKAQADLCKRLLQE